MDFSQSRIFSRISCCSGNGVQVLASTYPFRSTLLSCSIGLAGLGLIANGDNEAQAGPFADWYLNQNATAYTGYPNTISGRRLAHGCLCEPVLSGAHDLLSSCNEFRSENGYNGNVSSAMRVLSVSSPARARSDSADITAKASTSCLQSRICKFAPSEQTRSGHCSAGIVAEYAPTRKYLEPKLSVEHDPASNSRIQ
jgi:hypothetical protein